CCGKCNVFNNNNCFVYISHFLFAWGDRMWGFGVGLFLINLSFESLHLTAAYGLCMSLSVLLFGALVGEVIDKIHRFKAAQVSLLLQNIIIILCAILIYIFLAYTDQILSAGQWLRYAAYVLITLLCVISQLASMARKIAVEKDWVVEMCGGDHDRLATMTATLRRIDLSTQILAPLATGFIMGYSGVEFGAVFIGAWTFVSVFMAYYLLWKLYNTVPALKKLKQVCRLQDKTIEECMALNQINDNVGSLKKLMKTPVYAKYNVRNAGLALALLYMTVLGFDGVTVGYAKTQGVSELLIGIMMALSASFGILGTFLYPFMRTRLGLARTGIVGLSLQISCLLFCVISVWMPGSKFDWTSGHSVTTKNEINCSEILPNGNVTLPYAEDVLHVSDNISVWMLLAGIITSRFGLWVADLTISQLYMESVEELERGKVNGVQISLNQLVDLLNQLKKSEGGRARGRGGRGKPKEPQTNLPPGVQQQVQQQTAPVARGRGRAATRPAAPIEPPSAVQAPPIMQGHPEPQAVPTYVGGGRGVQRGGGRERPTGPPTDEMGALSLRRSPRSAYNKYVDAVYKASEKCSVGKSGESPEVVGAVKCFDGGILYLQKLLPKDPLECVSERSYDKAPITVTFKFVCEFYANSPKFLQIVNLMLKRVQITLDMKQIRDHYFNIHLATKIPKHRIETFHSVRQNAEEFRRKATKELGVIVLTKHNNKTYKVDDIAWDARASDCFEKNGQMISYSDYYKEI
ncbi:solute carrier family 40 member 1, partial [Biomphalaria pfeifferi]